MTLLLNTMLNLQYELQQGYQADAWCPNPNNLQDLQLLDDLYWKEAALWCSMSLASAQCCCESTTTVHMLAVLASIRHCAICSVPSGGKVRSASQTVRTMYNHVSHAKATSAHLASLLVCCSLYTLLMPLGTVCHKYSSPACKAGFDAIIGFGDRLTKYVHLASTHTTCTATTLADLFMHVFCNHGLPLSTVSDKGTQFAGHFSRALADKLRITWNLFTAFHPQNDGQTEHNNRTVEDMPRHFVTPTMTNWDELLVSAQFAVNNAWQEFIRNSFNTPFFLNHGRQPRTP